MQVGIGDLRESFSTSVTIQTDTAALDAAYAHHEEQYLNRLARYHSTDTRRMRTTRNITSIGWPGTTLPRRYVAYAHHEEHYLNRLARYRELTSGLRRDISSCTDNETDQRIQFSRIQSTNP